MAHMMVLKWPYLRLWNCPDPAQVNVVGSGSEGHGLRSSFVCLRSQA